MWSLFVKAAVLPEKEDIETIQQKPKNDADPIVNATEVTHAIMKVPTFESENHPEIIFELVYNLF